MDWFHACIHISHSSVVLVVSFVIPVFSQDFQSSRVDIGLGHVLVIRLLRDEVLDVSWKARFVWSHSCCLWFSFQ